MSLTPQPPKPQEKKCKCCLACENCAPQDRHDTFCPLYTPPAQEGRCLHDFEDDCSGCKDGLCCDAKEHLEKCVKPPQPKEPETNKIKEYSKFIECKDCTITTMNDDDNVCLKCGSKNTKRLFMDNNFKKSL